MRREKIHHRGTEGTETAPKSRPFSVFSVSLWLLLVPPSFAQTPTDRLIAHALNNSEAYEITAYLSDNIGPRLSGSPGAEKAVRWTTEQFRKWGIPVRNEKVLVPHWVRGAEHGRLVSHNNQTIVLTALGGSVATPRAGITADVVPVSNFEELERLGRRGIAGKIVLYTAAMDMDLVRGGDAFAAYSNAVEFRGKGADRAAEWRPRAAGPRRPGQPARLPGRLGGRVAAAERHGGRGQ